MAFHLTPDPSDPGEPQVRLGRVGGAEAAEERRILRDGIQVLAHGAMLCPTCDLPMPVAGRIAAGTTIRCGFCDHVAPARHFVREDVYDTLANEVYLVARVA
jgi:hypothetical protein